jgi:hypothetical protein
VTRPPGKTSCEIFAADRPRLKDLAGQLTADGPGRFGQAETVRWLLDQRDLAAAIELDHAQRQAAS